jgi:hypothetical protein
MNSMSLRLIGFLLPLWAAAAWAAVDCDKASPATPNEASRYLHDYAQACTKNELDALLARWKLQPQKADENVDERQARFKSFPPAWQDIASRFTSLEVAATDSQTKQALKALAERARAATSSATFALEAHSTADFAAFRQDAWHIPAQLILLGVKEPGVDLPEVDVKTAVETDCSTPASELCRNTVRLGRSLMQTWKLAEGVAGIVSAEDIAAVARQVGAKEALWKKYLYSSKPMLPPDFFATDLITGGWKKSDQFGEGFHEPPSTQWFFLHPSVGIEYASAAADGQQFKPVLHVEIIGANWWNEGLVKLPGWLGNFSGVALLMTYADRDGVKDTGVGGLFTFNNVYSIGVTKYGSATGISFSIDLANMFREKYKDSYEKYKSKLTRLAQ